MSDEARADVQKLKIGLMLALGVPVISWLGCDYATVRGRAALQERGTKVEGAILDCESKGGRTLLSYLFTVNGQPVRVADRPIPAQEKAERTRPLAVWYDPSRPTNCVSELELRHLETFWTPLALVGLILAVAGVVAHGAWRLRRLRAAAG
jgi:hypothetical protein